MNVKKLLNIITLAIIGNVAAFNVNAATHCTAYIYGLTVTEQGVDVRTSNNSWDKFYIEFQDRKFASHLEKLALAKYNFKQVKMYIIEEYDGDDGNRCGGDNLDNYIKSITIVN